MNTADTHYDHALACAMQGRLDEAIAAFRRALGLQPGHVFAGYNLGLALYSQGRLDEAAAAFERVLGLAPDLPEAQLMFGLTLHRLGRLDEAAAHCARAIALRPGYAEAHNNLANIRLEQGRLVEAAQSCQAALAHNPGFAVAHYNLGLARFRQHRLDDAVAAYQSALSLQPEYAPVLFHLGQAYDKQGRLAEAAGEYRRAVTVQPDYAEAWYHLGSTCLNLGRLEEALTACQKAADLRPDHYAYTNLGHAFLRLRRFDEARASYRQALALKPDLAPLHANLGLALTGAGRMDEAMRAFDESLRLDPASAGAHSAKLCSMHYLASTSPEASYAAHREFAARCETPLRPQWRPHTNTRDPERRLRIGYVSADFNSHSVAHFIEPVLARHERACIEVFCYYSRAERDEVTARLEALADRWLVCAGLTDEQLAGRIRADGIDLLVDLAGHTSGHRLLAFARKPAPVQVTYLGYPATTGLTAMDYRLCTLDTDPPGAEAWHSETLYRLPRTLWCYRPLAERTPPGPTPAAHNGYITFGSMNNLVKVTPEMLARWAEILRAVPSSRLIMTNAPEGSVREDLRRRLATLGIAPGRLIAHDRLPNTDYWQLLRGIDIALDPFPYAGTTTTCETLWAGIPVVTLTGQTSVARSGYALLSMVGLEELAAADADGYVRLAVALANDPQRLARLRRELPARFDASALRDEAGLARDLENAFRDMWRAWCRTPEARA